MKKLLRRSLLPNGKPLRSLLLALSMAAGLSNLDAQVRTWLPAAQADDGEWMDSGNWSPSGVPNSPTATAVFNVSGGYYPYLNGETAEIGHLIYDGNIGNYGLQIYEDSHGISVTEYIGGLIIHNEGVTNTSASTQTISVSGQVDDISSYLQFRNAATAGNNMNYFIQGGALISFGGTSNAGTAQINVISGTLYFGTNSTGQQSSITNNSDVTFTNSSTADRATITNQGTQGNTLFTQNASAGQANITNSTAGSLTWFSVNASAAQATITNLSGGATYFFDAANGTTDTTIDNQAGGAIDISRVTTSGVTLGQVLGAGNIYLGSKNLAVGGKGENATLSGVISDGSVSGGRFGGVIPAVNTGGSLTKDGFGTYQVTAANTYTGGTTINAGTFQADNTTGSATGTGAVTVNLATLTGTGRVEGPVTVNGGGLGGSVVLGSDLIINNNGFRYGSGTVEGSATVNSGGRLGGTGTILGDVTINAGGRLEPGYGPNTTLTTGNLFLDNAAILAFEFGEANAPGSAYNDVVNVNGNLTLDGILNVSVSAGGDFGPGLYRMFNYTGTLIDNGVVFGSISLPGEKYVQTSVAGQVNLINTDGLTLNFWDGTNPANYNNGTVNGGTGTWQLNPPNDNWTDSTGSVNVPYENGQFVVFQGTAGTVTVDNTNGAVTFAGAQFATDGYILQGDGLTGSAGTTTIRVGDGTIFGEDITATINAQIGGATTLQKTDLGTLVLGAANTYTGGTILDGGTLVTQNADALGTGALTVNAGLLRPDGQLNINGLNWNGGGIQVDLNQSPHIAITGDLTNGGGVREFLFDFGGGGVIQQNYTLVTFTGVTNFTNDDFAGNLDYSIPNVQFFANFLVTAVDVQLVLGANAGGPLLQNSAPVLIPTFADFFVEGPVTTGAPNESNTINSLTFANGSSLEVFNDLTVTSGNFTVSSGTATLNGGSVIVPGDFNLMGPGMLIADTNFEISGAANIYGAFLVNDTFSAPGGLTVFQTGLLGGSGVINGNVVNSGIVSPGNSPGVLTINGNFTQTSAGTLLIELASTSVFDQLIVNGDASLAGTLQIESFGGFIPQFGQQFDFLQANSITGEFDTIALPNPELFRGRFLAEDGVGTLLIAPASYTLLAQTQNQFNVAQALDSFIPATSGDRETVSIALDLQTAEEYPAAFNAIAPTFYESLANITIEQTNAQNQLIAQRLSAVRLGSRGFSAVGIEAPLMHDKDGKSVMDAKEGKDILTPTVDNKWGVWVQGNGIFSQATTVSQIPNYRFNSGGFLVGADYKWSENFTTGVYAGYQGTYAKYEDNSNLRLNSALFGGYATYDNGGFYADAIVGGGYTNYTAKRSINFSTIDRVARSQPGGGQFTTYLDMGYDWEVGGFTFGPIVSGQYTYAGIAPFTENGADSLDLQVGQQNANSIRTNIGGRIAYTWNVTSSITFVPEVRMFWQHEFLNNPRNIAASLDGGSGPGFGYETTAPSRDSVFAGAGVSARFGDRWDAYVYYNADFGRQDYLSHIISAGLGWKF